MERFAKIMANAFQQARSVSDSEHYDHHRWISERIKKEQERRKFYEALNDHVAKWGAISIISGVFYAIWLGVKQLLRAAV